MAGQLEAVRNLITLSTLSVIHLSWQPPFSLNLTTAELDIVYCVDILNITNHQEAEDFFQFVVTPRSNVKGARNGTPSVINMSYSLENKL